MRALAPLTLPVPAAFEDYRFALERPLFHPSRRPFPDRKALVALEAAAKAKQPVPSPAAAAAAAAANATAGLSVAWYVIADPVQSAIFERPGKEGYVQDPSR